MNSFFASCEQQVNYYLRGRPVGVCVYTGKYGCVIAPSVEAKRAGVKTGMRLNDAIQLCPDLVPIETNPARYREFHVKIMNVLRKYADDVLPKSIDEAVVNLTQYKWMYKDPVQVAYRIKEDIKNEVGDWLRCSIGVAPNTFLAKLASDLQKPDGLTIINPENIDTVLAKLDLQDLPGISSNYARRLERAGITNPLKMRYTSAQVLREIFKSVEGYYWHYRLNFYEFDINSHAYKSMQAQRQISKEQRSSVESVEQVFMTLCMRLEQRMVKHGVYCKTIGFTARYGEPERWDDYFSISEPIQDGIELMNLIRERIDQFLQKYHAKPIFTTDVRSLGITVTNFVKKEDVQPNLFEDRSRQNKLRETVYEIKNRFGDIKLLRATELTENMVVKDVIGFGSVKDL
jgi:DNA polymerase-4